MNIHFADVWWETEDIKTALNDAGIETTEKNVSKVLDECLENEERIIRAMTEAGWEFIYDAVETVFKDDAVF